MNLNFLNEHSPVSLIIRKIERGEIDPLVGNRWNNNLLHLACERGNLELIEFLVTRWSGNRTSLITALNSRNKSPLDLWIASKEALCSVDLVFRENPMLMSRARYLSLLRRASKDNNISILRYLVEEDNYIENLKLSVKSLFIDAISVNEVRVLPYLLTILSLKENISVCSLLLASIHQACRFNSLNILVFLINAFPIDKRDILEAKDSLGRTPLHYAVLRYQSEFLRLQRAYPSTRQQEEDIEPLPIVQYQQQDPVMFNISAPDTRDPWKLVEFLVNAKADVNAQDAEGNTPICHLLHDGSTRMLQFLVRHGGELEIGDNEGNTCLHKAAEKNQLEIVKYIIEKKQFVVDIRNNKGFTPLIMAISHGNIELTRYLLSQNASVHAENVSAKITRKLVKMYNVDIHVKTFAGFSALHFACAGSDERRSLVQLLLDRDSPVDAQDSLGRASIFLASSSGNSDIVRLLLSYSANPLVEDRLGNSLIHITSSLEVIRILLGEDDTNNRSQRFLAYALLTKTNCSGETPIEAAKRSDVLWTMKPSHRKMRHRYLQSFTVNPIAVGTALRFNPLLTSVQLYFADRMFLLIRKLGFCEELAYAIIGYLSPLDVMRVM